MYKRASQIKLRIVTPVGVLSVEQLWDLSLENLDAVAVKLEKEVESSAEKSFLVKKTEKNKELKLAFDIVLDVLTTKLENQERASKAAETKAHNQKILGLIAQKQEGELQEKSVEELQALLK